MHHRYFRGHVILGSAVAALMFGVFAEVPTAAAGSLSARGATAQSFSTAGKLGGIAAVSGSDAWAVGVTSTGSTLIMRWNGRVWTRVSSPSPRVGGGLQAVAATSAKN